MSLKRPENQFLTYLNIHDRALTNATVRKLMHTIDKEDVEGEVYCEFFSAENFYRNMRDYYSYIGKCTYKGDTEEVLKFMYERHGSREDDDNTGKRA